MIIIHKDDGRFPSAELQRIADSMAQVLTRDPNAKAERWSLHLDKQNRPILYVRAADWQESQALLAGMTCVGHERDGCTRFQPVSLERKEA